MSKRSKNHSKRVAARNQRLANKTTSAAKIIDAIERTGMATPNEARFAGKIIASKGRNPGKVFQRKQGS
jgi:hypothetical protein